MLIKIYPDGRFDNIFVYFACLTQMIDVWGVKFRFEWMRIVDISRKQITL